MLASNAPSMSRMSARRRHRRLVLGLLVVTLGVSATVCCAPPHALREPCLPGECDGLVPGRTYLWQTSSEGSDVHIVDLDERRVVTRLLVGPQPHGIAAPADHRVVYLTIENDGAPTGELLAIDPLSLEEVFRMEVGPEPHALETTPDGRWIYVPCRDEHYWVVDARSRAVVRRIHTGGRPHNTSISTDGRRAFLSPMGDPPAVTVVDVEDDHRPIGRILFSDSVRPPALTADGRLLFQHVDELNGFEVADTTERRVVARVQHETSLGWIHLGGPAGWLDGHGLHRCHGLAIRPDQEEIWSVCGPGVSVHAMRQPRYPPITRVELSDDAYWMTFSPDGRFAFVPILDEWRVAMIDTRTKEIVTHFEVGPGPKRNLVLTVPANR